MSEGVCLIVMGGLGDQAWRDYRGTLRCAIELLLISSYEYRGKLTYHEVDYHLAKLLANSKIIELLLISLYEQRGDLT